MREIRFRAWDKGLKQMFYDKDCFFTFQDGRLLERDGEKSEIWVAGGDEIMMWTGLHDKNGKEIWEGDIVKGDDGISKVFWSKRWSSFEVVTTGNTVGWWKSTGDLKVIGNIYENPELLGEKK